MTDPRTEAAANVLAVNDMQAGPPDMLAELRPEVAEPYRQLAAKQLAAADAALDWGTFTTQLELRGFDQGEQDLILFDVRDLLGLTGDEEAGPASLWEGRNA